MNQSHESRTAHENINQIVSPSHPEELPAQLFYHRCPPHRKIQTFRLLLIRFNRFINKIDRWMEANDEK